MPVLSNCRANGGFAPFFALMKRLSWCPAPNSSASGWEMPPFTAPLTVRAANRTRLWSSCRVLELGKREARAMFAHWGEFDRWRVGGGGTDRPDLRRRHADAGHAALDHDGRRQALHGPGRAAGQLRAGAERRGADPGDRRAANMRSIAAMVARWGIYRGVQSTVGIRKLCWQEDPRHWTDIWFYGVFPAILSPAWRRSPGRSGAANGGR